jgi:hypothetical protein
VVYLPLTVASALKWKDMWFIPAFVPSV